MWFIWFIRLDHIGFAYMKIWQKHYMFLLPTFRQVLKALRVKWLNLTPRFASGLKGAEAKTKQKYKIINFLEGKSNPQSVAFTITRIALRHDWPK